MRSPKLMTKPSLITLVAAPSLYLARSMRLQPVPADAGLDHDRDLEREGVLHLVFNQGRDFVALPRRQVEDQLVMDLEDHAGLELSRDEFAMDFGHGEFDHVGGRALDGSIDGV